MGRREVRGDDTTLLLLSPPAPLLACALPPAPLSLSPSRPLPVCPPPPLPLRHGHCFLIKLSLSLSLAYPRELFLIMTVLRCDSATSS